MLDNSINLLDEEVKKAYLKTSKKIISDMNKVYKKILEEQLEGEVLTSHLYQYNRYYELLNELQVEVTGLGIKENNLLTEKMEDMYFKSSMRVGASFNLQTNLNKETVERIIKKAWVDDGMTYSDRIWKDKSALVDKLKDCLIDATSTGKSSEKLTEDLMRTFDVSYNNANRLIRTELSHTQIQATIDKYKEAGIKYYIFNANPGCCDACTELNNKKVSIEDTSMLPPLHPNCRCSILADI